jgi:DNA-binding HxlR family transcriptional regulator
MARTKTYGHYCAAARALEVVGEKWSLLVVRDLLSGPQRFSDLLRSLGGITPKLLTARLRELEGAGVVERDEEPGRREVWYRLSAAGRALKPVIEELLVWGIEHALPPAPGEPVNPRRAASSAASIFNHRGVRPAGPTAWAVRFDDAPSPPIRFDGERWSVALGEGDPIIELTIEAPPDLWVAMLRATGEQRAELLGRMRLTGDPERADEFVRLLVGADR